MRELVAALRRGPLAVMRQAFFQGGRADGALQRERDANLLVRLQLRHADENVRLRDFPAEPARGNA